MSVRKLLPEYQSWHAMRGRCLNPSNPAYSRYGGRGIKVCDRWSQFENFLADMGERPAGTSLDREDTNGNYEPGNCRWATREVQNTNRRDIRWLTINGETRTHAEWCRQYRIGFSTVAYRTKTLGWSLEQAITTPKRPYNRDAEVVHA